MFRIKRKSISKENALPHLRLEIPFERREYERDWEFPDGTARLNIEAAGNLVNLSNIVEFVFGKLSTDRPNVLIEIQELYSRQRRLFEALRLEDPEMVDISLNDPVKETSNLSVGTAARYIYNFYSVFVLEQSIDYKKFCKLDCNDMFITFWSTDQAIPIVPFLRGDERSEIGFLANLNEHDPMVFFDPGCRHLEVMTVRTDGLKELADMLSKHNPMLPPEHDVAGP